MVDQKLYSNLLIQWIVIMIKGKKFKELREHRTIVKYNKEIRENYTPLFEPLNDAIITVLTLPWRIYDFCKRRYTR